MRVTHGHARRGQWTPEYRAWVSMIGRCLRPTHTAYSRYGARGVGVCARWLGKHGFENFVADVGPRPGEGWSIDRIDPDGHYEPENVRWLPLSANSRRARRRVPEDATVARRPGIICGPLPKPNVRIARRQPREGAVTKRQCQACGQSFASVAEFAAHRVGPMNDRRCERRPEARDSTPPKSETPAMQAGVRVRVRRDNASETQDNEKDTTRAFRAQT